MANKELLKTIRKEIISRIDKRHLSAQAKNELVSLLSFLDTLESEKPVPNDLEEAANKFAVFYDQGTCDGIVQDCFIAGAKWQAEQDDKELSDLLTIAHLQGAEQMKEQMLKEAVEAKFISMDEGIIKYSPLFTRKLKQIFRPSDKVRIIIVKEDEK